MSNTGDASGKFWTLKRFLEEEYLLVHLNTSAEGLDIPGHLRTESSVTLKLSQYFKGQMKVTQQQIVAQLLFNGDYAECVIPLDAIWGCHSERGNTSLWPESAPDDVVKTVLSNAMKSTPDEAGETGLRAAGDEETDSAPAEEAVGSGVEDSVTSETTPTSDDEPEKKLPKRGHLRRIK